MLLLPLLQRRQLPLALLRAASATNDCCGTAAAPPPPVTSARHLWQGHAADVGSAVAGHFKVGSNCKQPKEKNW